MTTNPAPPPPTIGAILAGGLARRMGGGDKSLHTIGGRTTLERIVDRLRPQTQRLILNANEDPMRFSAFHLPVIADSLPGHPGPLAGVLAVLDWTAVAVPAVDWVVTAPGDAPFIPPDLVARLHTARRGSNTMLACAASLSQPHPVVALWPVAIRNDLRRAVAQEGLRKVGLFMQQEGCALAEWPATPVDPFFNVNTPGDLARADRLVMLYPDL